MSIGQAEVETISKLTAISVEASETATVADQLSNILALFAQMEAVDTTGVQPMSHPLDQVQRLREDCVTETNHRDEYLKTAPATEAGMFLVPQVIE